ncbi:MAG: acetylglutamate kinase [Bacteroidales bacterium]|nr:acetylglutamate kinase [Bacteroidales bacterium]
MKGSINVIKVGGAVVEDPTSLGNLLEQFANIKGNKVLVHGGGRSATKIAASLGIESTMVGGRRITDGDMLNVVTMVYGGLVNKTLVALLQAQGVNAIGLTGADMNVIRSHKRPEKSVTIAAGEVNPNTGETLTEETKVKVDFGWVGDVDKVDGQRLTTLIESGIVPIMAPLTHDGEGHILNTNADTIASQTACGLAAVSQNDEALYDVTLTYCFEKPGVLSNPDDDSSVISFITEESYQQLKADGIVSGGMIPKLDNAFEALHHGVSRVVITSANDIEGENGTTIVLK